MKDNAERDREICRNDSLFSARQEIDRLRAEVEALKTENTRLKDVIASSRDRRSRVGTIARLEERFDMLWNNFTRISDAMKTYGIWTPGSGGTVAEAAVRAIETIEALKLTQLKPGCVNAMHVCRTCGEAWPRGTEHFHEGSCSHEHMAKLVEVES